VVACPLCQVNLDARQKQIIYFTQLMGLAFGLKSEALGLDKHFVDPVSLLQQVL